MVYHYPFVGNIGADGHTKVYISSTGKQHEYYGRLHQEYGDIVRTGELFWPSVLALLLLMRLRS
jgi:hypothetical protein